MQTTSPDPQASTPPSSKNWPCDPVGQAALRYIDLFAGRTDDFFYYSEIDDDDTPARRPLTPRDIVRGLEGSGPTISLLFLDGPLARTGAIDVDIDDGWDTTCTIARVLIGQGIACAVERSRRGGHLWMVVRVAARHHHSAGSPGRDHQGRSGSW